MTVSPMAMLAGPALALQHRADPPAARGVLQSDARAGRRTLSRGVHQIDALRPKRAKQSVQSVPTCLSGRSTGWCGDVLHCVGPTTAVCTAPARRTGMRAPKDLRARHKDKAVRERENERHCCRHKNVCLHRVVSPLLVVRQRPRVQQHDRPQERCTAPPSSHRHDRERAHSESARSTLHPQGQRASGQRAGTGGPSQEKMAGSQASGSAQNPPLHSLMYSAAIGSRCRQPTLAAVGEAVILMIPPV